jgi:tRNA A37 threonylcarbamoyladenosine modification protein TsaB
MNLFIDTISAPCFICIFDNKRDIIANISWDIVGNESSTLIPKLEEFL